MILGLMDMDMTSFNKSNRNKSKHIVYFIEYCGFGRENEYIF